MPVKNADFSNAELRRALKGFPKGLRFTIGWSLKGFPMQMHVWYKRLTVISPLLVRGDKEKLSRGEIIERTIRALYKCMDSDPNVVNAVKDAMYWQTYRYAVYKEEHNNECKLRARIYIECYKTWYKDWVKKGRKVNV